MDGRGAPAAAAAACRTWLLIPCLSLDYYSAHRQLENFDEAKTLYTRAVAMARQAQAKDPTLATPMVAAASTNLGNVYQQLGDYHDAVGQHRIALQMSPETADAHFNLGVSLIAMGGPAAFKEANILWRQTAKKDPSFGARLVNQDPEWIEEELAREAGALAMMAEQTEDMDPEEAALTGMGRLPAVIKSLRAVEQDVGKIVARFKSIFWLDAGTLHLLPLVVVAATLERQPHGSLAGRLADGFAMHRSHFDVCTSAKRQGPAAAGRPDR
eukprot:SAG22_NODE_5273_length_1048_cov_1.898841_2_plen_269_part_01